MPRLATAHLASALAAPVPASRAPEAATVLAETLAAVGESGEVRPRLPGFAPPVAGAGRPAPPSARSARPLGGPAPAVPPGASRC